jgi:phospholipid/cholesterol/gamma-HCH transport system permease protein
MSAFVAQVGGAFLDLYDGAKELYSVFVRTLYYLFKGKREPGAVTQQLYEIGNKSLLFLCVTLGFIGMIMVYQSGVQARRVVPDFTMLGATFLELLVRDFAASIGALMLATRVGAGIAADPIDFLIVPRFIACMIMTTILVTLGGTVAFCAGGATAYIFFDVRPDIFFNMRLIDAGDVITGFVKCLAYGAAIPVVSGYCGLSTFGGSEGVGWATTRAVVNSSLAILVLNAVISTASFLVFPV